MLPSASVIIHKKTVKWLHSLTHRTLSKGPGWGRWANSKKDEGEGITQQTSLSGWLLSESWPMGHPFPALPSYRLPTPSSNCQV